jgi:hypothetical protein
MARPSSSSIALLVLLLPMLVVSGACSGSDEQQLLTKYFQASRMRDNTTLGNIATVAFSPTEDGIVQSFDVVRSDPEKRRPLRMKELAAVEAEARKAEEAFNKQKKEYQDANIDAIDRVLKAEREGKKLRGKDLEVQTAWTKWRDDTAGSVKKVGDARKALASERSLAELSVFNSRNPVNVTLYDGDLVTRDLVIRAKVKKGDAAPVDQDLHVRVERVELRNGPADRPQLDGRWIITHVSPADDGNTPPPTS